MVRQTSISNFHVHMSIGKGGSMKDTQGHTGRLYALAKDTEHDVHEYPQGGIKIQNSPFRYW
jgi:predicted NUDIX family phosphoesterase